MGDQLMRTAFADPDATESERAAARWELSGRTALHAAWILGLAVNEAAPESVARRVFTVNPLPEEGRWLSWSRLTPAAARAAAAHPDPKTRRMLAENPDPAVLTLLADDPETRVRATVVFTAEHHGVELGLDTVRRLAHDPEPRVRHWAGALPGLPDDETLALAEDPDPRVRAAALSAWSWPRLRPEVRAAAEADPDPEIRKAVERATRVEAPLPTTVEAFRAETDERRRRDAAYEAAVDEGLARLLVTHEDAGIRAGAARNPHLPTGLALSLAADADDWVRLSLSLRADLTEEQRAAIDYTVPEGSRPVPDWIKERYGDPDALRELAASSHVLLRRAVAAAPELPDDVVELLASDEDYFVRLTLCGGKQAPHELLVEMLRSWDGLSKGTLLHRPHFARPGLARFADDPDDWLRYAALFDPERSPELVERLSRDPSRLVRDHAARDPRLPYGRLVELLDEDGEPQAAAFNPALPVELMHGLLDLAGVAPAPS
ncbi:LRV domain-containing protein [Streptomyces purpureus]|uniref:LRV domain-containing protein n=1 Tax=Streptomyces purpureus TaxID=1951 RepID=UPI0037A6056E